MLTFQDAILKLQQFWVDQGAVLWQPYSEKVGAGTMNPATILRVLGPEPWNVVYVEPSYRPDDGRYADNPNRMQMHTQMQVILKPDPDAPQEQYLKSLEALGIQRSEHDIRFVEDNWESPALGAWGLGWEVWLDGQEITQYTYFQQAGGIVLEVPAVEITYGLERIVLYLQNKESVWDIQWDANYTYGEILRDQEIDHCRYDFDIANIDRLRKMYVLYEQEARLALKSDLVVPALDYILRCSHTFNLLDSRGTVGVTERSIFFKRMRDLARKAAELYLNRREKSGYPWLSRTGRVPEPQTQPAVMQLPLGHNGDDVPRLPRDGTSPFLFEIGVEELPASHLDSGMAQLDSIVHQTLSRLRLNWDAIYIWGTPRRLTVFVPELANKQSDEELFIKGPPARIAFDADGNPTQAANGFVKSQGVEVDSLEVRQTDSGLYVFAYQQVKGENAVDVLVEVLPEWIASLNFPRSMRWKQNGVSFSRPIRWLVAMFGEQIVPFTYCDLNSGRITRGPRSTGSQDIALSSAGDYKTILASYGVMVDIRERRNEILKQARILAESVDGRVVDNLHVLDEVVNLVEVPTAILGSFDKRFLTLPQDVLVAVMEKHQRYFPVVDARGRILPYFITVRNGNSEHSDIVKQGNEAVIRARYADAAFFYNQDCRVPLASYRKNLDTLVFHEKLGSMLDKSDRLLGLAAWVGDKLNLTTQELDDLERAAYLCKADLVTKMVVEMTSLQGVMGREYARKSGESAAVAKTIVEHYLPRYAGDMLPGTKPGIALALADRLDSLAGLFAVGAVPSGSADPYGLRRTAVGLVQILLSANLAFSIRDGLHNAAGRLPVAMTEDAISSAVNFVTQRLRTILREEEFAHDVVAAVLHYKGDDPGTAREYTKQLSSWIDSEGWTLLLQNYARCVRITRATPPYEVDPQYLLHNSECELWTALQEAQAKIKADTDIDTLLNTFVPLIDLIDIFFTNVMVMVDDVKVRRTRLALLQRIADLAEGIVDLSKLESF
jgi:glycyl-tRNA synthetase